MEAYRLNSRIVEDDKEFLVRTENDAERGIIRTSIYINGEFVDSNIVPHEGEFSEEQVLELVKNAHGEKKAELEFLLKNFREVLNNGSPDMMCQLGKAMYYKKMYAEAARLFGSAIKLKEDMHEAYFYLGQTELAAGNVEAAIRAAGEAVKIRPAFADYRNNLGEALLDNDNWRDAMEQFDEAIRKNVYYGDAYFNKALAHLANALKQEDPDIASEFQNKTGELLEKAALIDPGATAGTALIALGNLADEPGIGRQKVMDAALEALSAKGDSSITVAAEAAAGKEEDGSWIGRIWCRITGSPETSSAVA